MLRRLGEKGITSVLVEGGPTIHSAFLREGLADRMVLFIAPRFMGENGLPMFPGIQINGLASMPRLHDMTCRLVGDDLMVEGSFKPD
jgi:diaminohydroxyphosphoribosylaminopyrimidine deaminase/5-amino-6-(5-phosphoribosylamino)uracil reductase